MREIKFRAWDKQHGWMCKVLDIDFKNKEVNTNSTGEMAGKIKFFELMQFTGLKDKNGKEIFEGDIVKVYSKEKTYLIQIKEGLAYVKDCDFQYIGFFGLPYDEEVSKLYETISIGDLKATCVEVIGNIYENPELLEVKK